MQTQAFGGMPAPQWLSFHGSGLHVHIDWVPHEPYLHAPHVCMTPQLVTVVLQYVSVIAAHGVGLQQVPLEHVAFRASCNVQSSHELLVAHAVGAVPG